MSALDALGLEGKVLVVLADDDEVAARSFANLPQVQLVSDGELNTYDVLRNDWVVFTDATLPGNARVSGGGEVAAPSTGTRSDETGAGRGDAPSGTSSGTDAGEAGDGGEG